MVNNSNNTEAIQIKRHSGLGITSFILSLTTYLLLIIIITFSTINRTATNEIIIGFMSMLYIFLVLLSLIFCIVSFFYEGKKAFSIISLILNLLPIGIIVFVFYWGPTYVY